MKIAKIIKAIAYTVTAAIVIAVFVLSGVTSRRGRTIRADRARIEALTTERDSLRKVCDRLGGQPAIVCTVQFDLRNNAVFGVNHVQANQVAEQVAVYTRREMMDIADSLNNAR